MILVDMLSVMEKGGLVNDTVEHGSISASPTAVSLKYNRNMELEALD
jgi:hypothetical protein